MGQKINYPEFIKELDKKLEKYFNSQSCNICCRAGCSSCCEKGDYPLSEIELEYLMEGFIGLPVETKIKVQENIKTMEKGGRCPFLTDKLCSVYPYRPIICRTHGLAYLMKDGRANVPYCVNEGKNYSKIYKEGELLAEPIKENLSTQSLISELGHNYTVRNLYDWIKSSDL